MRICHMRRFLSVFIAADEQQVVWIQFQGSAYSQANGETAIPEGPDTAFKSLVLLQLNPASVRHLNLGQTQLVASLFQDLGNSVIHHDPPCQTDIVPQKRAHSKQYLGAGKSYQLVQI